MPAPEGPGVEVEIRACGLCGSDVEKLRPEYAGAVLGHEVVALTPDGRRVALLHHAGCGECERCRAGHESTCESFRAATIRPGGFAERARADAWVELPHAVTDALGTYVEPLACVLRGAERVPRGRVLVIGQGFVGRLFAAVLRHRGDEVFAVDADPARSGPEPDGPVAAAVLCAPGGAERALEAVEPAGTVLVFADAGALPAEPVYRKELTVRARARRRARRWSGRSRFSPTWTSPSPRCCRSPASTRASSATDAARRSRSSSSREGAPLPRARRRAARGGAAPAAGAGRGARPRRGRADRRHRPEGVPPRPSGAAGRSAEPFRSRVLRDRRRERAARGRGQLGAVRRVRAVRSRPGGALRAAAAAPERRLRRVPARAGADRAREPPPRPAGPRARGGRDGRAARVLPARRRTRRGAARATRSRSSERARSG